MPEPVVPEPVTVHHGFYLIDTPAWLAQRVGAPKPSATDAVRTFINHPVFRTYRSSIGTEGRVLLWCAAVGWTVTEASPLFHDHDCLTEPIAVVLATTSEPARSAAAICWTDTDLPTVYTDLTADDDTWLAVDVVDIVCPGGHRWTWPGGPDLIDHHHGYTTVTQTFGRRSPLTDCPSCVAYQTSVTDTPCDCDGVSVIDCPSCGQRCRLQLPDISTVDASTGGGTP